MASIKALAAIALTLMIAAPIGLGYLFATEDTTVTSWESENRVNLSDTILNSEHPIYGDYQGTSNNTLLETGVMQYNDISSTDSAYPVTTPTVTSTTFTGGVWVDLSAHPYWKIIDPNVSGWYYLNNDEDRAYRYSTTSGGLKVAGNGGSIMFESTVTLPLTTYSYSGDYADINGGWMLPASGDHQWLNGFSNSSVTILVDVPVNSATYIGGLQLFRSNSTAPLTAWIYGVGTAQQLGQYQYVKVTYGMDTIQVAGITSWPAMGTSPLTFNTLTFDNPSPGAFTELRLYGSAATFRVDGASVNSGTFPDTKDYTLDMDNLFPGKSYSLKLNSIGIYGDSLTIAGETFTVTNGRISVDGSNVSLKGATISSKLNGAEYDVYVNAIKVGSSEDPASIAFDGEWSLTLTADILKTVENTNTQWAPGEFAFDKTDFAACGLLVAGGLLVGLGMYGQRSGIKFGVLLLICGGAALIYLTFV